MVGTPTHSFIVFERMAEDTLYTLPKLGGHEEKDDGVAAVKDQVGFDLDTLQSQYGLVWAASCSQKDGAFLTTKSNFCRDPGTPIELDPAPPEGETQRRLVWNASSSRRFQPSRRAP